MNAGESTADFSEMDNAGISAHHWKIMFISGMGFFTDAYDLFIIGVVMALVKPLWHVGKLEESLVESTALLAAAIGALLFGRVADMLGRKRIYGVEVLVLAAGAIGCAFAPNIWWLIGLRFILGIGIGGDYPVSATIMSEYCRQSLAWHAGDAGLCHAGGRSDPRAALRVSAAGHASFARHHLAYPRRLRRGARAGRLLAAAAPQRDAALPSRRAAKQEDEQGRLVNAQHFDSANHSVSFWDGFHRLVNDNRLLLRLIGASAAWFLMDAAYYGNTVSSPLVLSALNGNHTLLQKTLTQLGIFAVFAAPGYAVAALTMDRLGRKTIQCSALR